MRALPWRQEPAALARAVGLTGARLTHTGRTFAHGAITTASRLSVRMPTFSRRTLTLAASAGGWSAVAFNGRRVVAWARIAKDQPLPPIFGAYLAPGARCIADLPVSAVLLRTLQLPPVQRRYRAGVVAAEVAEHVPFNLGDVDVVWRDQEGGSVISAVAAKAAVDDVHTRLGAMHVRPWSLYPGTLALAAAAGLPDGVVVRVQSGAAQVIALRRGVPGAVHEVSLPDASEPTTYASVLAQAVEETWAHDAEPYRLSPASVSSGPVSDGATGRAAEGNGGSGHVDTAPAVVLMGDTPAVGPRHAAFAAHLGGRLMAPVLTLPCPPEFPSASYAANLGLFLLHESGARKPRPGSQLPPALDLFTARHGTTRVPRWATAGIGVGLLVIAAGAGFVQVQGLQSEASALSTRVARLERQARTANIAKEAAARRVARLPALAAEAQALEDARMRLEQEAQATLAVLRAAVQPASTVRISAFHMAAGELTAAGEGQRYEDVAAYAAALRATGLFTSVRIANTEASRDDGTGAVIANSRGVRFTLKAGVASMASATRPGAAPAR